MDGEPGMATLPPVYAATLRRTIAIAREAGLPDPDEVTFRARELELVWDERKLVLIVEKIPTAEELVARVPS
jgi:hypothetical protein